MKQKNETVNEGINGVYCMKMEEFEYLSFISKKVNIFNNTIMKDSRTINNGYSKILFRTF